MRSAAWTAGLDSVGPSTAVVGIEAVIRYVNYTGRYTYRRGPVEFAGPTNLAQPPAIAYNLPQRARPRLPPAQPPAIDVPRRPVVAAFRPIRIDLCLAG